MKLNHFDLQLKITHYKLIIIENNESIKKFKNQSQIDVHNKTYNIKLLQKTVKEPKVIII